MVTTADGFVPLVVSDIAHDTDDSVIVTFDPSVAANAPLPFVHGQHLTLRRAFDGVEVRRSYSICSPAPGGALRVAIKHVPGGAMSTWATQVLRAGDTVDVLPPAGHFTHELDAAASRRYTVLAAGSGITPVFSIVATILATEPRSHVALVYLNRSSRSTMLLDELHELHDRHLGRLTIAFAFSREETGGELLSGRPDRARLDAMIAAGVLPAADHAFLCGPIDLITTAAEALIAAGMPAERIHRELFTTGQVGAVATAPQRVDERSVAVATGRATLHGRTSTFDLYDGDSVLDAVQRVRPDAPYSCRSGVCSTCQAVLREGTVEMTVNYGLSADEVGRGYVLTCQSHPTSDQVVVDYDA